MRNIVMIFAINTFHDYGIGGSNMLFTLKTTVGQSLSLVVFLYTVKVNREIHHPILTCTRLMRSAIIRMFGEVGSGRHISVCFIPLAVCKACRGRWSVTFCYQSLSVLPLSCYWMALTPPPSLHPSINPIRTNHKLTMGNRCVFSGIVREINYMDSDFCRVRSHVALIC